ncbi:MAG: polysaccharide biosynthesis protein [Proteobacteria bacterium]|nr:polysaccharide biosynthesis protein [Pseudomonadota bacterium]
MKSFISLFFLKIRLIFQKMGYYTLHGFLFLGRFFFLSGKVVWLKIQKFLQKIVGLTYFKKISQKRSIAFFHDIIISLFSYYITLSLYGRHFIKTLPLIILSIEETLFSLSTAGILFLCGLYGKPFRYPLSLQVLEHTKIAILSCLVYAPLFFITTRNIEFPASFLFALGFVFLSGLILPRVFYFSFFEKKSRFIQEASLTDVMERGIFSSQASSSKQNILLIGRCPFLENILKSCSHEKSPFKIVGYITDKNSTKEIELGDIPILGDLQNLSSIIKTLYQHGIKLDFIAAIDINESAKNFQFLLKTTDEFKTPIKRLIPSISKSEIQVDYLPYIFRSLTLEDLLDIHHSSFDSEVLHQFIHNHRILITGAGGSLAGALIQKLASLKPQYLSFIDHSEENLLKLDVYIQKHFPHLSRSYILCDITNKERLLKIFEQENPTYVFHLAAIKSVPFAEMNPDAAALTNILGTRNVLEAAHAQNVKLVGMASSTSCSKPQNVLDVTKRISEIICQSFDTSIGISPQGTRFIVCRFDNLIDSSGSITALFEDEIRHKGPLLLTRPDDERIFIPLKDAALLFLKACLIGGSPSQETGALYEARISTPIKIKEIADFMCLLKGLTPQKDIKYKIIGPRPGEETPRKFLIPGYSEKETTSYKGLFKIKTNPLPDPSALHQATNELNETTSHNRTQQTLRILHYLVPSYKKKT